jgi:TnpA family transposase
MIEDLPRYCADAGTESDHADTHGAGVVGFALTELLSFRLPPRPENIDSIRLYRPGDDPAGRPSAARSREGLPGPHVLIPIDPERTQSR